MGAGAVARWRQEQPGADGLGRLERLALEAVRRGCQTPPQIFAAVAAADTPPQFWGDTTLWCKINGLADRPPTLLHRSSHFSGWVGWRGQRGLGKEDRLKGLSIYSTESTESMESMESSRL